MQLVGYLDSPFVRRVAVSMEFLGIAYEHRELSIFRNYDEFRELNPVVKVPTLVLDDGQILVDSGLILDYLETQVANRSLIPSAKKDYRPGLQYIGFALIAMEKVAQLIYETSQRPEDLQHGPWITRLEQQIHGAVEMMESAVLSSSQSESEWLFGPEFTQADISIAVAWRFIQHIDRARMDPADFPGLAAFSEKAETLPEFLACPLSG